ncbi:universal stress protein [Halomonas piscis]|uniref:universal stress protein n=1 Tax=Halomonas piscis TaxID=3031727 RepID=UPI0028982BE5|nr:universal stress protein [Halomonas piscis]
MTTHDDDRLIQRVVVLLDGSRRAQLLLDEAARLAKREGAELVGLFVEDTELLRAASLPLGGEIGLVSGSLRPVAPEALERRLRQQAGRLQALLAATAGRHALRWRLEVNRDRLEAAALAATMADDLLVLYRAGWRHPPEGGFASRTLSRMLGAARCRVMMLGERVSAGAHPILVFQTPDEAGQRAMNEALRLAQATNQELLVLLPPGVERDERTRAAIEAWSARQDRRPRYLAFEGDIMALIALLQRERAGALVLPRGHALLRGVAGEHLLEASDSALIVVP